MGSESTPRPDEICIRIRSDNEEKEMCDVRGMNEAGYNKITYRHRITYGPD